MLPGVAALLGVFHLVHYAVLCHTLQRACFPIQYPQQYYFNLVREDRTGIVAVDSSTQEVQLIWCFARNNKQQVVHSCLSLLSDCR